MAISKKDAERMINLAKEGKKIPAIVEEDFPQYDYWDVFYNLRCRRKGCHWNQDNDYQPT
ncbi:MAG: hypothetical protein HYX90_04130 [Chloroflexi bacterium]|nr:hypothetical protein [Chloroflexota bacterium]